MKSISKRLGAWLGALLVIGLLAGCGSTIQSRINEHPEYFAGLPQRDQNLILSGQIRNGFERLPVYLAWGRPSEVFVGEETGGEVEVWQYYETRTEVVNVPTAYYVPPGRRRFGYSYYAYQPIFLDHPVEGKRAQFLNGKVTSWQVPRF